MVATKSDAHSMIETMSATDFSVLRDILNSTFEKSNKRLFVEKTFVAEVSAAEKSVDEGNYVTLSELREFLGV
ncbi:MAG: hypothetical protein K6A72_10425 [Lachnospiraceae bacterium]|nr:hypothetical protein [Lachnospiraceae bacterium]